MVRLIWKKQRGQIERIYQGVYMGVLQFLPDVFSVMVDNIMPAHEAFAACAVSNQKIAVLFSRVCVELCFCVYCGAIVPDGVCFGTYFGIGKYDCVHIFFLCSCCLFAIRRMNSVHSSLLRLLYHKSAIYDQHSPFAKCTGPLCSLALIISYFVLFCHIFFVISN